MLFLLGTLYYSYLKTFVSVIGTLKLYLFKSSNKISQSMIISAYVWGQIQLLKVPCKSFIYLHSYPLEHHLILLKKTKFRTCIYGDFALKKLSNSFISFAASVVGWEGQTSFFFLSSYRNWAELQQWCIKFGQKVTLELCLDAWDLQWRKYTGHQCFLSWYPDSFPGSTCVFPPAHSCFFCSLYESQYTHAITQKYFVNRRIQSTL